MSSSLPDRAGTNFLKKHWPARSCRPRSAASSITAGRSPPGATGVDQSNRGGTKMHFGARAGVGPEMIPGGQGIVQHRERPFIEASRVKGNRAADETQPSDLRGGICPRRGDAENQRREDSQQEWKIPDACHVFRPPFRRCTELTPNTRGDLYGRTQSQWRLTRENEFVTVLLRTAA